MNGLRISLAFPRSPGQLLARVASALRSDSLRASTPAEHTSDKAELVRGIDLMGQEVIPAIKAYQADRQR